MAINLTAAQAAAIARKKKKKSSSAAPAPTRRVRSASPVTSSVGGATSKTIGLPVGSVSAPSSRTRTKAGNRVSEALGKKATFGRSLFPGVGARAQGGVLPRRRRRRRS